MHEDDSFIDDVFVEDDVSDIDRTSSEETQQKTLEELLPRDCIVLSLEEGRLDPLISVRGRYLDDLGEAASFIRLALAKLQYYKHVQERS